MITFDRRELEFQLFDVAKLHGLCRGPFSDYEETVISGVLDTAEKLAREKFLPHAEKSDQCEPRFEDGRAVLIPEIGEALEAYREAGLFGATFAYELGGIQMPETLRSAISFLFFSANIGTSGYILLTNGAANVLSAFATPEQQKKYLRPLVEGRYFGTMCLSESHAGSSLADITTTAQPQEDGTYHLHGNKMWISGGEQDISENIVHLVLAKVPGVGEGTRGISLFIAPKYRVTENGDSAERNGISLAGLNHKMGYRGTTNTVLNFGEEGTCIAHRIGDEGKGLQYMFHMMNEARIAVGLGATALAAAGYSVALQYARERLQGRSPDAKDPSLPPVPILQHGDVRRLLLSQKVSVEGSLALLLYTAGLIDRVRLTEDQEEQLRLRKLTDFLTPIAKSWPSEFCLDANKQAIQVLGGAGYMRDYPLERLYRDNRLNPIHEGTHGIHGIDLLGRKTLFDEGRSLHLLAEEMQVDIDHAADSKRLAEFANTLAHELAETLATTRTMVEAQDDYPRSRLLANATLYLDMLGHVVVAWMWLRQALAAEAKASENSAQDDHLEGKYYACRYFFRYVLPQGKWMRELAAAVDDTTLSIPDGGF